MSAKPDDTFDKVRDAVARTFRVSPETVTPQSAFGELPGWDSLSHLALMMEIESEFSIRFPTDAINTPQSIPEICKLINAVRSTGNP